MCYKFVVLLFSFWLFSKVGANPLVVIAYEDRPGPPHYLGEGFTPSHSPGITPDLLNLIALRLKYKIEYRRYPWSRCLSMLGKNQVDAVFHASFKPERLKLGVFPMKDGQPDSFKKVHRKAYVLYKLKGSDLTWDGKQFQNLDGVIGATYKYSIVDQLRTMGLVVDEAYNAEMNFRKLVGGRLVGVVDLENIADFMLSVRSDRFSQVVKVQPPISVKDYYIIFSHHFYQENTQLVEKIWNEIYQTHKNGDYEKIAKRYLKNLQ
ncbi:substrate-binding periplasmic protein [Spartinivicinus ruber]|uniref:substrate-binding periplasmic protein n=1 Tax=Spartinivicinus ruber TaxID=2683272 RepID=UPI0013D2CACA|nr:transporter substrate-binding domain-containing protein [Spartinivicinus ruber]